MRAFAELFHALERSSGLRERRELLGRFIADTPKRDLAWALFLLMGGKLGDVLRSRRRATVANGPARTTTRLATTPELRQWAANLSGLPLWLVELSHDQVGDLAETLALLVEGETARDPGGPMEPESLADWIEGRLLPLAGAPAAVREAAVLAAWQALPTQARLVFNKLLTGTLRIGVSSGLVRQALAAQAGLDVAVIVERLQGVKLPADLDIDRILAPDSGERRPSQPYPFQLANPLTADVESLGPIDEWQLEWKWDGIRAQLIRRGDTVVLWSRGEERLDGRFPELEAAALQLPRDAVLDGEILAWSSGEAAPLSFRHLQTRINRLRPGAATLRKTPACLLVYDLLELAGEDWRNRPLRERQLALRDLLAPGADRVGSDRTIDAPIRLAPVVVAGDWVEAARQRDSARERGTEGLMLKRLASPYQVGRTRGDWWKWKVDPLTIDAVLIYAQTGHGRRSSLYTDYTFALWQDDGLVPVAKAYSGLDDQEIATLDRWIRSHTRERFGPVRSVEAHQVFELAFEGVNVSTRHKSGIAVRFPRILRWRTDKRPQDANRLADLQALAT